MPIRRGPLSVILVSAMVASTFSIFALAVLASAIIDDLGVSRTMVGVFGSVNTGVGALTAPYSGRLTDRIGPRNAVLVLLTAVPAMGHAELVSTSIEDGAVLDAPVERIGLEFDDVVTPVSMR